jgi:hypothetical protein
MPVYNDGTGRRESGRYPTLEDAQWAATQLFEAYRPHAWIERITTSSERVADSGAASPRPGAEATSEDTRELRAAVSGLRAFARYFAKGMRDQEGHLWTSANAVVFAYEAIERHLAARSSSGSPASKSQGEPTKEVDHG